MCKDCNLLTKDIDECLEEVHTCEQSCNNVNGSYTCGCDVGYILSVDLRSCIGKPMSAWKRN